MSEHYEAIYNERRKAMLEAYKACMGLLRLMADEEEGKGEASAADALRKARGLINVRHDSVFRNLCPKNDIFKNAG